MKKQSSRTVSEVAGSSEKQCGSKGKELTVFNSQGFADKSVTDGFAYHAVSFLETDNAIVAEDAGAWSQVLCGCEWESCLLRLAGWYVGTSMLSSLQTSLLLSVLKRKADWSACDRTQRDFHPRPLRKKMRLRKFS